jgi:hypothetical protein
VQLEGLHKSKKSLSSGLDPATFRLTAFFFIFITYLVHEAVGTAVTPGLLCQPQVIVKMIVE